MNVHDFIARLDGVRSTGVDRWSAKCPAHQDKSPSLSVRGMGDGRILFHCFAGCESYDVLLSMGLLFRDVMPENLGEFKPVRAAFSAYDALNGLAAESLVIAICASDIANGRPLDAEDAQRVRIAAGRIQVAMEGANGRN